MNEIDKTVDSLIIGTGPVGATFARILGGQGARIIMIDAGKQLSKRPGQHLKNTYRFQQEPNLFNDAIGAQYETYSIPESILPWKKNKPRINFENPEQNWMRNMPFAAAVYAVGGMSTIWTASTPDPAPFELTEHIPTEDWKLLLPIAKKLLNVHDDVHAHSHIGQIAERMLKDKGFPVSKLPMAAQLDKAQESDRLLVTYTGSDTILGPLLDESHEGSLKIYDEIQAEELILEGQTVKGARVRNLKTQTVFEIHAGTVIAACGSFATPRLLWSSGIRYEALGRYLNDHLETSCSITMKPKTMKALRDDPSNPFRHEPHHMSRFDPGPGLTLPPAEGRPWHGVIHRVSRRFMYLPSSDVRRQCHLTWYGMVDISPDNRITFSDTLKDRYGLPQISIHFRLSMADRIRRLRMMIDMLRAASTIGRVKPFPVAAPPGSTLHLQGTYRMGDDAGEDDTSSIVNSYSKVWGYDNLYLGGLGTIPNSTATNPTMLACAIAVRAAAHLRGVRLDELAQELHVDA